MKTSDAISFRHLTYLRKRYRVHHRIERGILDSAALADVVLLLLLFFIVGASNVVRPGIRVNLPVATQHEGIPYRSLVVTISQEGLVFFNDERTTLEGLGAAFERMAFERSDHTLVIEADERVSNGMLVQIYEQALAAGIKDIAIATRFPAAEAAAEKSE